MKRPPMRRGRRQPLIAVPFMQELARNRLGEAESISFSELLHTTDGFSARRYCALAERKRFDRRLDELIHGPDEVCLNCLLDRTFLVWRKCDGHGRVPFQGYRGPIGTASVNSDLGLGQDKRHRTEPRSRWSATAEWT